jgi:hypothetical protein
MVAMIVADATEMVRQRRKLPCAADEVMCHSFVKVNRLCI